MNKLPHLNLPDYPVRFSRQDGRLLIWDRLRKKFVALTPEEYVRQRFVEWMIVDLRYPEALMNNEVGLDVGGIRRRCDTIVFDRSGKPHMVVEYKAPDVQITQNVFDQVARYNMTLRARYLVVSNGITHYCCRMDHENNTYHFIRKIPDYTVTLNISDN